MSACLAADTSFACVDGGTRAQHIVTGGAHHWPNSAECVWRAWPLKSGGRRVRRRLSAPILHRSRRTGRRAYGTAAASARYHCIASVTYARDFRPRRSRRVSSVRSSDSLRPYRAISPRRVGVRLTRKNRKIDDGNLSFFIFFFFVFYSRLFRSLVSCCVLCRQNRRFSRDVSLTRVHFARDNFSERTSSSSLEQRIVVVAVVVVVVVLPLVLRTANL